MAKKKKSKLKKKVSKKTPKKKAKKKTTKKVVKKSATKKKTPQSKKKSVKKAKKKVSVKVSSKKATAVQSSSTNEELESQVVVPVEKNTKPAKKKRKKRVTKAETLRLLQQEQLVKKWNSLLKQVETIETVKYNMKNTFKPETGLKHKTLGWGFILSNTNDRLEVLFEGGIKNLISNYKSR